jgi:dihydrofolate synthase/folylpolyglutamate synthase
LQTAPDTAAVPGYREALGRLYALGQGRMLPGRERLRELLQSAGDPHLKVPSVLIGGTNGKGRLTATLSAVLSQRYVTGAFIKPHLKSVRERWRVGDKDITPQQFVEYANRACDLIDAHAEPISFFEANVLLGSLLFADHCELALWEVGLGGRYDACNLVEPLLSVITNVQYDHQAILGSTLAEIATEKASIARVGKPLLLGPPREGWEQGYAEYAPVVERIAGEIGARFIAVEAEDYRPLALMPSDTNSLLQASLDLLARAGYVVNAGDVLQGLRSVRYRARMEYTTLLGVPALVDAAHNPDSMRWLAHEVQAHINAGDMRAPVLVFGCQATKDIHEMLEPLANLASTLVPISVPVLHPAPVSSIIEVAEELGLQFSLPDGVEVSAERTDVPLDNVTELDPPDNSTHWIECVQHAATVARERNVPLVICGSIYYIGEILRAFEDGWVAG